MRKIGQNEALQEEKYNDKSIIYLPRQYTNQSPEPLIFLDFLNITKEIYY